VEERAKRREMEESIRSSKTAEFKILGGPPMPHAPITN
jgi:hypothetical protein